MMSSDNTLIERGAASDNEPTALDRRTHRRFPVELEVTLESEHNFFAGFTENLSEGGLFIATHQIVPVGSKFRITFTLEGMFGAVDVLCEVCWLRPYHERLDAPAGMGVRFIEIDDETLSAIRQFIQARDPIFYED